jgi:hypothetical protein
MVRPVDGFRLARDRSPAARAFGALLGTRSADQAAAEICANYLGLVDAWRR